MAVNNWPAAVIRNSQQTGTVYFTLYVMAMQADWDTGTCYPGIKSLARATRTSERTVKRAIRELTEAGEIEVRRNASPYSTNLYTINPALLVEAAPEPIGQSVTPPDVPNEAPPMGQIGTIRGATAVSPEQLVKQSVKHPLPDAREEESLADLFNAYANAAGIMRGTPAWPREYNSASFVVNGMQTAGTPPTSATISALTVYTLASYQEGGIRNTPTFVQVLDRLPEYNRWRAANPDGDPSQAFTAAPKKHRRGDRPAAVADQSYWEAQARLLHPEDFDHDEQLAEPEMDADAIYQAAAEQRRAFARARDDREAELQSASRSSTVRPGNDDPIEQENA